MIIIQGSRMLSTAHFTFAANVRYDCYGNRIEPYTIGLGSVDLDATGSINGDDVGEALHSLVVVAVSRLAADTGMWWGDLL